jgi:hypothetical protein
MTAVHGLRRCLGTEFAVRQNRAIARALTQISG